MSDTDNRKSMDDVLASIRRIVRSEKDPEEAVTEPVQADAPVEPDTADPMTPMTSSDEDDADSLGDADAPLALTPDMRMDDDASDEPEPAPEASSVPPTVVAPAIERVSADSDGKLRGMIREVLQEQMSGAEASEFVRSVIRDELVNGEIGNNISQNVMSLIQSEIAKAMAR